MVVPEKCASFDFIPHGPLFPEAQDWPRHVERWDVVTALEKALAASRFTLTIDGREADVLEGILSNCTSTEMVVLERSAQAATPTPTPDGSGTIDGSWAVRRQWERPHHLRGSA